MKSYPIKKFNKDYTICNELTNIKGSRQKIYVEDKNKNKAFFKYEKYLCSEACSEKICYELAKVLGYKCAKIELAKDSNGNLGVLNYVFINPENSIHSDIVSYLKVENIDRKEFYTISNIKLTLDKINENLFDDFIKIMIFDALVGEQDRHEENWGITKKKNTYELSPLYDNGCNLLREFKNEEYANYYYEKHKDFDAFIKKSKCMIYKEDNKSKYKHFDLIKDLYCLYERKVEKEINNLNKLSDNKIKDIVNKIPSELLTDKHKEKIIEYVIKRRDILLNIKYWGDENE